MTWDQAYIATTALAYLAGFMSIAFTLHLVSRVRRIAYIVALPLWAGFTALFAYVLLTGTFEQGQSFSALAIGLRALLFGVALEGLLVPFIDRLEARTPPPAPDIQIELGDSLDVAGVQALLDES